MMKIIRKGSSYRKRNEIVRLENEIVITEIIFEIVYGWPYKGFQNSPIYQFGLLVTVIIFNNPLQIGIAPCNITYPC